MQDTELLKLKRVMEERDYDLLEANSAMWDVVLGHHFSKAWFLQPSKKDMGGPSKVHLKPFQGEGNKINPTSKTWCNYILYDERGEIAGRYFAAGVTPAFMAHHSDPECQEPIFPVQWSDLYVPNPADPSTAQNVLIQIFGDYERIGRTVLKAVERFSELFEIDRMITQVYRLYDAEDGDGQPDLNARAVTECGFRFIHSIEDRASVLFPQTGERI